MAELLRRIAQNFPQRIPRCIEQTIPINIRLPLKIEFNFT